MIQPRSGYANYYFNLLNRNRVWESFRSNGDFSGLKGAWVLEGDLSGGGAVQFDLQDDRVTSQFAGSSLELDASKDLDGQLMPNGSGGLLVALHLWRHMLLVGLQEYGEVYYLGTAPIPGREGNFDVLAATHGVIESRVLFDPKTGHLAALEIYPDSNVDPCELYFDDYREVDGRMVPHRLEVRFGNSVFAEIQLKKVALPKPTETEKDA